MTIEISDFTSRHPLRGHPLVSEHSAAVAEAFPPFHLSTSQVLDVLQGLLSPQQTPDVCQVLGDHLMKGSTEPQSIISQSEKHIC